MLYGSVMDLAWVWAALAAIAATTSTVWSGIEVFQTRSPFRRYEQWGAIARDQVGHAAIRTYAEGRIREHLVEFVIQTTVARIRRRQWAFALALIVGGTILFLAGARAEWFSVALGFAVAVIFFVGDLRIARIRRQTYHKFYGAAAPTQSPQLANPE